MCLLPLCRLLCLLVCLVSSGLASQASPKKCPSKEARNPSLLACCLAFLFLTYLSLCLHHLLTSVHTHIIEGIFCVCCRVVLGCAPLFVSGWWWTRQSPRTLHHSLTSRTSFFHHDSSTSTHTAATHTHHNHAHPHTSTRITHPTQQAGRLL